MKIPPSGKSEKKAVPMSESERTLQIPDIHLMVSDDVVNKTVHWYLCEADSYDTRPQREEIFEDAGFYKFHEAYHLLKFPNEKQILEMAYGKYIQMRKEKIW